MHDPQPGNHSRKPFSEFDGLRLCDRLARWALLWIVQRWRFPGSVLVRMPLKICCLIPVALATCAAAQEAPTAALTKLTAPAAQQPMSATPPPAAQAAAPAAAPEMSNPRIISAAVDWADVRTWLAESGPSIPSAADTDPVAQLNEATKHIFPKIDISPIPVLLPFDTAAYLRD